MRKEMK